MKGIFRQEAIDAQREKLLGEVSMARPVPTWIFTLLAVAAAAALIAFALLGSYTRRERVEGFLAVDGGAARILAPEIGTLSELMVKEGDEVKAGATLARVSLERSMASGASATELVQREMAHRATALNTEKLRVQQLADQQREQLQGRGADLRKEIQQLEVQIRVQQSRVASAGEDLKRTQELIKAGFVSETALTQKRADELDQQSKLEALKRDRAAMERDLRSTSTELPTIATRASQQIDLLDRQISELKQNMVQEETKRELVIRAPMDGVITNIAAAQGESLHTDTPIALLLPKGSRLQAQLLVPTRAIGFVRPGNDVVLRYEAFPYQRFGQHHGKVETISQTVWSAGEKVGAMTSKEPVYRIDVKLDEYAVSAGGQSYPLKPGMQVNADILLERRTIFEWVFEPVLQFRERMR
jgi:membrane fusion protein